MDYPFTSWNGYFTALTEHLSTEYYGETYPLYQEQHESVDNVDVKIVDRLLKDGLDPQEGLDGFIEAVLDGSRYAAEFDDMGRIITLFLRSGATPNMNRLFQLRYPEEDSFEDEIQEYEVRGILIDLLSKYVDTSLYNWASIDATHWEDIDEEVIEEDYQKACYMMLKHSSGYLRKLV